MIGVHLELGDGGAKMTEQLADRIRMKTADGSRMVQFGSDMIALNALPPYDRFENYLPAFQDLHAMYLQEASPTAAVIYGQRYINRIHLPSVDDKPDEYFAIYPDRFTIPYTAHPGFSVHFQARKLNPGALIIQLMFEGVFDGRPRYLLDLYARADGVDVGLSLDWSVLRAWQVNSHEAIFETFESALTDHGKRLLGREGL